MGISIAIISSCSSMAGIPDMECHDLGAKRLGQPSPYSIPLQPQGSSRLTLLTVESFPWQTI